MKVLAIYGSPRKNGNTAQMMNAALSAFDGKAEITKVYLCDMKFSGCGSCRKCHETGSCVLEDDMQELYQQLIWADIIIIASPTHFSGVGSNVSKLMERTWCMRGKLKNKIGGSIVSCRRYVESTFTTLVAFMLRHKMILGCVAPVGYVRTEMGTLENDPLAIEDSRKLGIRLIELYKLKGQ